MAGRRVERRRGIRGPKDLEEHSHDDRRVLSHRRDVDVMLTR